ncbi:MAG: helix-turn-helix domain-containing protein [Planctomycetota bacterium]|nr:helix-turn-helix domain-containing protein [Planctomycetota bacterium]
MATLSRRLPGASVLPPMSNPTQGNETSKAKGHKPSHKATRDRFAVLNEFVDLSLQGLTRAEIGTWLVLYRDTRNGTAKTSQGHIAKRLGVSSRSVRNAISKLADLGLLVVVYQGGLNKGLSVYRVASLRNPSS